MTEPANLHRVVLNVNDTNYELAIEPRRTLADTLRHDIGLTGTHLGCEHGVCGACTVLVDDLPCRSCLVFAVQVEGQRIRTVESLAALSGELNDLQAAFARNYALQCGFCTPGFLMLAESYLPEHPTPSREEIRALVAANICRCTGYEPIVDAIAECARERNAAAQ